MDIFIIPRIAIIVDARIAVELLIGIVIEAKRGTPVNVVIIGIDLGDDLAAIAVIDVIPAIAIRAQARPAAVEPVSGVAVRVLNKIAIGIRRARHSGVERPSPRAIIVQLVKLVDIAVAGIPRIERGPLRPRIAVIAVNLGVGHRRPFAIMDIFIIPRIAIIVDARIAVELLIGIVIEAKRGTPVNVVIIGIDLGDDLAAIAVIDVIPAIAIRAQARPAAVEPVSGVAVRVLNKIAIGIRRARHSGVERPSPRAIIVQLVKLVDLLMIGGVDPRLPGPGRIAIAVDLGGADIAPVTGISMIPAVAIIALPRLAVEHAIGVDVIAVGGVPFVAIGVDIAIAQGTGIAVAIIPLMIPAIAIVG